MAVYTGTSGNDYFSGDEGAVNRIDGGDGHDALYGGYIYDEIFGGIGNDLIRGYDGGDDLYGEEGDDSIEGDGGDDYISVGNGDDFADGGAGDDIISLFGTGSRQANGGSGDDIFRAGAGVDRIDGGTGEDTVQYFESVAGVSVNLIRGIGVGGNAEGDTYRQVENVMGSLFNDTLVGNGNYNWLYGYNGNDVILGGVGGDYLDGGDGIDTVSYATSDIAVKIDFLFGTPVGGDASGDELFNFENITGSENNDGLNGDNNANELRGLGGDDKLLGRDGNDLLMGQDGNDGLLGGNGDDLLYGLNGNDVLYGEAGADKLYGGAGADAFVFKSTLDSGTAYTARDTVMDFVQGQDKIDLSGMDAIVAAAGDQAFTFVGAAGFSGISGELRAINSSGSTFIYGDVSGDKVADFMIGMNGTLTLGATDFVL